MHAQADSQVRLLVLAAVLGSDDLALDSSVAEAAGDNDTINLLEFFESDFVIMAGWLKVRGLNPDYVYRPLAVDA